MTTVTVKRKESTFLDLRHYEWFVLPANNTLFIKVSATYARRLHDDEEVIFKPDARVTPVKSVTVETE